MAPKKPEPPPMRTLTLGIPDWLLIPLVLLPWLLVALALASLWIA